MRPSRFRHGPHGLPAQLLRPMGWLSGRAAAWRARRAPACRLDVPVICVGRLSAGGTGMTPTVIALAQRLTARGMTPAVIFHQRGKASRDPVEVDGKNHEFSDVGDVPLLSAAFARTWVGPDYEAAARAAAATGAAPLILVDSHQTPLIKKDISILTVDAAHGFGNRLCRPAGPLRESLKAGLDRADLLLSIGADRAQECFARCRADAITLPHLTGRLTPLQTGMDWTGTPFLAFSGIAHPERFFVLLKDLGATLTRREALEAHQPLTRALMSRLETEARQLGAQMVTTEIDAIRLPDAFRRKVLTLPVRLDIADWRPLDVLLDRAGL